MSNVASLENCKRLYELSGWGGEDRWFLTNISDPEHVIGTATPRIFKSDKDHENGYRTETPAYSAGYLLRKLPEEAYDTELGLAIFRTEGRPKWEAGYDNEFVNADTPEDALCLLAIKLFEEGVLGG